MNNFEIGECFEQYILDNILKPCYFDIVLLTHNYNDKYFVESNLNPDFRLRCKTTKIEFWVESKFRKEINKNYDLNENQFNRYLSLKENIFYIIGIGRNPKKPDMISLLKIDNINSNVSRETLLRNLIQKTEIKNFNELIALTKK